MRNHNRIILSVAVLFFSFPSLHFGQVKKYNFQQESPFLVQAILDSVSIDSMYQTEQHLTGEKLFWLEGQIDSIKTRHSFSQDIKKAQGYLQSHFEKMGYTVELQPFDLGGYRLNNIIATKLGTVSPLRIFILCAHYDSTSPLTIIEAPGADDNGSGTAVVVEAARVLADYNFPFSIKFVLFSGEEQGKYGSKYYAEQAFQNDENIAGVINLDMIGYDGNNDGIFEIHTGYELESQNIGNLVAANVTNFNLSLTPQILAGAESTTRSDHYSFWVWNYPGILMIEDFFSSFDQYPFYHSTSDVVPKLNPEFYFNMARLSIGSLATLASIDSITSVIPEEVVLHDVRLYPPYPNPFNPSVNIEYQVSAAENISLKIFDSLGRLISVLIDATQNSGNYLATWNGLNTDGEMASSGIYFVILQADRFFQREKIILLR